MACRGVLFSLDRAQADKILQAESDEAVMEMIEEIAQSWDEDNFQYLDKAWDSIHRTLSDGSLDLEAGHYPLNQCILNGKQLHEGEDNIVSFVTPGAVRHIASALDRVTEDWFRERFFSIPDPGDLAYGIDEEEFGYAWAYLTEARDLYRRAAAAKRAVIFTADQ